MTKSTYSISIEFWSCGIYEFFEGVLSLITEDFFLQKVVEMLKNMIDIYWVWLVMICIGFFV